MHVRSDGKLANVAGMNEKAVKLERLSSRRSWMKVPAIGARGGKVGRKHACEPILLHGWIFRTSESALYFMDLPHRIRRSGVIAFALGLPKILARRSHFCSCFLDR